ncbi:uncharacterized protein LOC110931530 [Helianthus annuus]|uniref:uncharacterized protein LOC110931530 n=1 Tax=Helianthus annuus TaxID=4232 RepID=UPI000B8F9D2B|nr:uncharacterized protein LOC110931530 [Helianthus annuus]
MSSSSSSTWYSSSSGESEAFFSNVIIYAAQMIMEEDEEAETSSHRQTRRAALKRDREAGHDNLVADYFADIPVYTDEMFRRWFRMSHRLFLRIADHLAKSDPFFTLRYDARGQRGFTTLQECTSAIHQLAYGYAPDSLDENLRMSERTAREYMHRIFGLTCFFGVPGSLNDLNIIYQSQTFDDIVAGTGPALVLRFRGWNTGGVTTLRMEDTQRTLQSLKLFRTRQTIKERNLRSFKRGRQKMLNGVLGFYKKWHIIEYPARPATLKRLRHIMYAGILLHNMIIEDEGRAICDYNENASNGKSVPVSLEQQDLNGFSLCNEYTHQNLQADFCGVHLEQRTKRT